VILTRNSAIGYLNSLTVAPVTRTVRGIPTEVVITPEDGMPAESIINLDTLQTIPKDSLGALITQLSPQRMSEIKDAIAFALGFDAIP
jgi:mRNA interferase MazF